MRRLGFAILAALALAACSAAHSGYPTQSCKTDNDCYLGERCMNNTLCIAVGADLAVAPKKTDMSDVADGGKP